MKWTLSIRSDLLLFSNRFTWGNINHRTGINHLIGIKHLTGPDFRKSAEFECRGLSLVFFAIFVISAFACLEIKLDAQEKSSTENPVTPATSPSTPVESSTSAPNSSKGSAISSDLSKVPTAEEIQLWISQLNDQAYLIRQDASRRLLRAGVTAIPALKKAALGKNPEVTARIVDLFGKLYGSNDIVVSSMAGETLEELASNGPATASVRTEQLMAFELAPIRRKQALAMIRHHGGHLFPRASFNDDGDNVEVDLNQEGTLNHIVLGRKWTGGLQGVKYLQRLTDLKTIYVTRDVPLTPDELDAVKRALPAVNLVPRGSAFLGVSTELPDPDLCIIHKVTKNSPAERGGLKGGDVVTHLDGLPVRGFLGLTDQLMAKDVGDHIFLEVIRDEEFLEIEVELGPW